MVRSIFSAALMVAAGTLMQGCATPTVPLGQSVEHGDLLFNFPSSLSTQEIKPAYGAAIKTNESFIRIEVEMLNRGKEPIASFRQPVFRLADESGNKYEPHGMMTIRVNSGRPSNNVIGPINPNLKYSKEIVFEVPRGKQYVLEVKVPPRSGYSTYGPSGVGANQVDFRVALPAASQPR